MLDEKYIESQKKKIEDDIERLKKEILGNSKFQEIGSDNEDSVLEYENFEEKLALNKTVKIDLQELEEALKQIEDGKYGVCKKCGAMIEKGRLNAYPAAVFCATHAQKK
jgi:DnaK suppressor protein